MVVVFADAGQAQEWSAGIWVAVDQCVADACRACRGCANCRVGRLTGAGIDESQARWPQVVVGVVEPDACCDDRDRVHPYEWYGGKERDLDGQRAAVEQQAAPELGNRRVDLPVGE